MTLAIRPGKWRRRFSPRARLFGSGALTRGTRCAIIVAHPGDEILGASCLISKLGHVSIVHVTDGITVDNDCSPTPSAERSAMAKLLRAGCLAALGLAQVSPDRIFDFLIPDRCAPQYLVS